MYLTLPGDEEYYPAMHQKLLDVFKEQDQEKARQAMYDHILVTAEKAIQSMEKI
jgi:DNA-binding FadR family transcriptional regulator